MAYPSRAELKEKAERVLAWVDGGCSSWGVPSSDIRALAEAAMRRDGPATGRSVVEGLAAPGCCGLDEPKDEVILVPATVL